jgi:uncharacterized protein (TIGR03118 family)
MRKLFPSFHKFFAIRPSIRRPRRLTLALESLEDRRLLSVGAYLQTNLVSDVPGLAPANPTDPSLLNPWGLAYGPKSPFWVSDNNAGASTLYTGTGFKIPLTMNPSEGVNIPSPGGNPTGGAPTGIVFNGGPGFVVSETVNGTTKSGSARFIWATEDGTIVGWAPNVDFNNGIMAVDNSANPTAANGAVYKGLTIATDSAGDRLIYASNFRAGTVDVFDSNFNPVTLPGGFNDPHIPDGYAPFGIQELGGNIYVTYAIQNAAKHDDVAGQGHGIVDVFNTDGVLEARVVQHGQLDSPWGLAIAPSNFGEFSNDLLVGNFRNGHINAFDLGTLNFRGELKDPQGNPIVIDGLWSLKFGNGFAAGPTNTLFFSAGINGEADGLFGSLQAVPVSMGPDAAVSLGSSAQTSAGVVSGTSALGGGLATVFISPADLQSFAPRHATSDDASTHAALSATQNSFDWNNDALVKELLAL